MSSAVLKTSEARSRGRNAVPVLQRSEEANWLESHAVTRSLCRLRSTSSLNVCSLGVPPRKSTAAHPANRLLFNPLSGKGKLRGLPRRKPYALVHCPSNREPVMEINCLLKQYNLCFIIAVVLGKIGFRRLRITGGHLNSHCRQVYGSSVDLLLSLAYPASSQRGNSTSKSRTVINFRCFRVIVARQTARAFSR